MRVYPELVEGHFKKAYNSSVKLENDQAPNSKHQTWKEELGYVVEIYRKKDMRISSEIFVWRRLFEANFSYPELVLRI